jgi:hypothetical protein
VFFFIGFPTESEEDAREDVALPRAQPTSASHFAGYIGTFGLGHDVPVFKDPERFGIDILYDEYGNPSYRRRDGGDWDFEHLHQTYRVRSDQLVIESCVAMLYAHRDLAAARRLTSRLTMGPPVFVRPALEARDAAHPGRQTASTPRRAPPAVARATTASWPARAASTTSRPRTWS